MFLTKLCTAKTPWLVPHAPHYRGNYGPPQEKTGVRLGWSFFNIIFGFHSKDKCGTVDVTTSTITHFQDSLRLTQCT